MQSSSNACCKAYFVPLCGNHCLRFLPYEEAKTIIHKKNLKSLQEWNNYCNSGKKPNNIPRNPASAYKDKWKSWGDWLGTGRIANQKRIYRSFAEARTFAQSLGLKEMREWVKYCTSGKKPIDIPYNDEIWGKVSTDS